MNRPPEIPALTALRGLAVMIVFISHAANDGHLPAWLGDGFGQMGVQLFFLLSGFLMVYLYASQPPVLTTISRFITARISRIIPLYWAVLTFSLAASAIWPKYRYHFNAGEFPRAFSFIEAPFELWSIPVEVQFYILFVLLWVVASLWKIPSIMFWILTVFLALPTAFVWRGFVSEAKILIPYAFCFLIGGVIADFYRSHWHRVEKLTNQPAIHVAAFIFLIMNIPGLRGALGLELTDGFYPRTWLDPFRIGSLALFFTLTLSPVGLGRIGESGHLSRIGMISFGFYLFHRPVIRVVEAVFWQSPGFFITCIAFGFTAMLAWLSFYGFEQPVGRALRAHLARQRIRWPRSTITRSRAGEKRMNPEVTTKAVK